MRREMVGKLFEESLAEIFQSNEKPQTAERQIQRENLKSYQGKNMHYIEHYIEQ